MKNGAFTRDFQAGLEGSGPGTVEGGQAFAEFFSEATYSQTKSEQAGSPIYDTVTMVRICIPGDPGNQVVCRARDDHKTRFRDAWDAFEKQERLELSGTTVDNWPAIRKAEVARLKHLGIYTVQQLAGLSDAQLQNVGMGAMSLRERAKAFLEAAETNKLPSKLIAERDALAAQVELLTSRLDDMAQRLEIALNKSGSREELARATSPVVEAQATKAQLGATMPKLPENWEKLKADEKIDLCAKLELPVLPRNGKEADELLREYATYRAAVAGA